MLMISLFSALSAVVIYRSVEPEPQSVTVQQAQPVKFTTLTANPTSPVDVPVDFTKAAAATTSAVVHIKTVFMPKPSQHQYYNPFRQFFGDDFFSIPYGGGYNQPKVASGSGVIISDNGFIVTNNHVIDNGDEIEVVLNDKRSFKAKVIGKDPSTDLALIKIEEEGLPYVRFGNSDNINVGEWVLAVGNPFNLASTVTAGIVSAKARNINILKGDFAIESFIQTDAAVNQGNSGGALVNINGELIGINTAIATPTGTYAGYAFAVPVNIVQKVVTDLRDFGKVQRGFLGVSIREINSSLVEEKKLDNSDGVYIADVIEGSGADKAGMKRGDIVTHIGDKAVNAVPELQEQVALYRPGDEIKVNIIRGNEDRTLLVRLFNKDGETTLKKVERPDAIDLLGASFRELTNEEKDKLAIKGGIMVTRLGRGILAQHTKIKEGFIITKLDKREINRIGDLENALENKSGGVMIEGVYPDQPGVYYYAFGL